MKCDHRALLIVTQDVQGTASNVAKERLELRCTKPEGHDGLHVDTTHGEQWEDKGARLTTLLRHEDPG